MMNKTKRWMLMAGFGAALASLGGAGCMEGKEQKVSATEVEKPAKAPEGVLINLTRGKDDLHAVTMAINMATQAREAGRPTTLFLNVHAPALAAKDLPEDVMMAGETPVKKLLSDFMSKGGQVVVCAHCLQVADMKKEDLVAGAQVVDGKQMLELVGRDVLSLSY